MTRSLAVSILVGGLLFAGAAPSYADTITFDNSSLNSPGGQIVIGSQVTMTFAIIDAVKHTLPPGAGFPITGSCGPTGNTVFGCLTITTGQFMFADPNTTINDYIYSGTGSSITITGGIAGLGLANNTTLFQTTFDPNSNITLAFDDSCVGNPSQCLGQLGGTLAGGTLNTILAQALGVNPNTIGGTDQNFLVQFTGLSLPASGAPSGNGLGNTNQLQVITPAASNIVPEPSTLILFGTGLVFAAKLARRRVRS